MVKGDAFWNLYLKTKDSCDKKCANCEMFLIHKNRCLHESEKAWKEWNIKQKKNRSWYDKQND